MKVKVCKQFIDKNTQTLHNPNEILDLCDARIEELAGYVKKIEEPKRENFGMKQKEEAKEE